MAVEPIEILVYSTKEGDEPFTKWVAACDRTVRAKIFSRLDRVESGNFGDSKAIGNSIYELRIHFGPGIRVYYGRIENKIVLLLTGGSKSTQKKDIEKARQYWSEFLGREKQ